MCIFHHCIALPSSLFSLSLSLSLSLFANARRPLPPHSRATFNINNLARHVHNVTLD